MEYQTKIPCQCPEDCCFLEEDAAWADRNYAESAGENAFRRDVALLGNLEAERLRQKSEWMERLRVQGTCQVCCRRQAEKSS